MKNLMLLVILCGLTTSLYAQWEPEEELMETKAVTVGFLNGGGALVGADMEFLVTDRLGLQVGAGFIAFGGAINYHFKPTIRSSFVSLQYWNQGIWNSFSQNAIGPAFVFRGKKWFTFQLGVAAILERGPAMPSGYEDVPVMLTYSIGAYFPYK